MAQRFPMGSEGEARQGLAPGRLRRRRAAFASSALARPGDQKMMLPVVSAPMVVVCTDSVRLVAASNVPAVCSTETVLM